MSPTGDAEVRVGVQFIPEVTEPADASPRLSPDPLRRGLVIVVALAVTAAGAVTVTTTFLAEPPRPKETGPLENGPITYLGEGPPSDARAHNTDLFAIDPRTGVRRNITESVEAELGSGWSPDGTQVAFVRSGIRGGSWGYPLFVLRLGDSKARPVHLCDQYCPFVWSPDGRRIAISDGSTVHLLDIGDGTGSSDGLHISGGNSTAKGLVINRVRGERYFGTWN
jgi:hypothetical protein